MKRLKIEVFLIAIWMMPLTAEAKAPLAGKWADTAPTAERIGDIKIGASQISVGKKLKYSFSDEGVFGEGSYFKITNRNLTPDPNGCGPKGIATYIVVTPIGPSPGAVGSFAKFWFLSSPSLPDPNLLSRSRSVCAIHPYKLE